MLPYALFAVLVCVFLWRPIFSGRALLPGDYLAQMSPWKTVDRGPLTVDRPQWNPLQWDAISQFYPWRVFYARSMRAGHIPLWNPHQFRGTPFLANGQSAVLYPPNLIFLLVDPITGFTIFAALHLFLAQVFMYWLMRELGAKELGGIVAAIVFAFSAFMVLWLELPTFVSVAVWLPLAIMLVQRAVERRSVFYGMLCGLALAMTFLAGHFQIAFYVVLATGIFWLWKMVQVWRDEGKVYTFLKVVVPFAGCVLIAILIAAPQVLPTQELAANSHRVRDVSEEGYQTFIDNALPAYRLVTAFAPGFFGDPSQGNYYLLGRMEGSTHVGSAADYMEYGMYAGILPLMLALIALASIRRKHVGFFVLLTALALLTATGTPINRLFYFGIPGFSALGGPNRILLLYLFGVAALAGFGFEWFTENAQDVVPYFGRRMRARAFAALLATIVLCALMAEALLMARPLGGVGSSFCVTIASAFLVVAFILVFVRAKGGFHGGTFSVLAVILIVADLFLFGINYNPTCERSKVYPKTKLTTELQRLTKSGERIAPINPEWSLFQTPNAILPPNAAMVYGLYDVQGYDSLYTRAYKDLSSEIQGEDSSPPENGNMVLVRQYLGSKHVARFIITRDDLSQWTTGQPILRTLTLQGVFDGVRLYRCGLPLPRASRMIGMPTLAWEGPRCVMRNILPGGDMFYTPPIRYGDPAWVARLNGRRLPITELPRGRVAVRAIGPGVLTFSYEPFTFRLGLFLMCVGVGVLSCVGVYRTARYRMMVKR